MFFYSRFVHMNIRQNISLLPFNTFGIDVSAKYFSCFETVQELEEILQLSNLKNEELLLLGGGSNILFTHNVDGLVLKNELKGIEKIGEDQSHYFIKAAAGENWHAFVMYCIHHNFAGLENLSLIPGCVGASPMQNIGAYGVEIKDVFASLEAYHIHDNQIVEFTLEDCAFGYRESVFKRKYKGEFVILNVTYKLPKKPVFNTSYGSIEQELEAMHVQQPTPKAIADAVIRIRSNKLPNPAVIGNAGSFFKNPEITSHQFLQLKEKFSGIVGYRLTDDTTKLAAGWLIEQCGWKGYRDGDAGVHDKQALVLVNYGHATGAEILQLSSKIIQSVQEKFGVLLEREVNII